MQTRRDFVRLSMAAGAAAAAYGPVSQLARGATLRNAKGLRILVLGGTGFIGPAIVEAARANGHTITIFNRGKSEKRLGTGRDDVEHLYGNRDPNKNSDDADAASPKGLTQIEERIKAGDKWDAVVDTSGYVPRIVKASADLLAPAAGQYIFISTISVYKGNSTIGADENDELGTISGDSEDITNESYGPRKAQCEAAVEKAFPGKTANIRPGFIVGPGDSSDRFTYWPVRVQKGGTVLAPGNPSDPVQFIDVRDLADFVVRCIEQKINGVYNANGPASKYTFGALLEACKQASGSNATFEWVDAEFLEAQGIRAGAEAPIWIPPLGDGAGFHQRSVAKSVAAGLKFRTPVDTCKATLAWWPKEVERRERVGKEMIADLEKQGKPVPESLKTPARMRAGMTPEQEAKVLEAWRNRTSTAPSSKEEPKK